MFNKYDRCWAQVNKVNAPLGNTKPHTPREVYINDTKFKRTIRALKVFLTTRNNWDMSWHLAHKSCRF